MITLKESILSRSSHGAKGFKAQRLEMIKKWLKEYDIENYTINDDFTIDVDRGVDLVDKELKEFPDYIQFGVVSGRFDCSINKLISLRGCPRVVKGNFDCSINNLTSREGCPKEVGGYFNCLNNQLTSLKGAPRKVGEYFDCSNNKLTTLVGAPKEIGGDFVCNYNQLISLEGAPEKVGGYFDCSNNSAQFTYDDVEKVCNVRRKIYY